MKHLKLSSVALSAMLSLLCANGSEARYSGVTYDPAWTVPESKREEFKRVYETIEANINDGDADGALRLCNVALTSFPNNEAVLRKRAAVYTSLKEYKKAIADYDRAIEQFTTPKHVLIDRAKVEELAGLSSAALADYDAFLSREPHSSTCFLKAKLLGDLGRIEDGKQALLDGLYLAKYENNRFWKERKPLDMSRSEPFQSALVALKLHDFAILENLRTEKGGRLFEDIEALLKLEPKIFVDLKFLGTHALKSRVQNDHRAVIGAPTERWSSINWSETPYDISLALTPNPLFASITPAAVRARFGEERKDVGQIACGPTILSYKKQITDPTSPELFWELGRADEQVVSAVRLKWTTEGGKQRIAHWKQQRILNDRLRGSQSSKMIARLQKIDAAGKPFSRKELESLFATSLYRSTQTFTPTFLNRNEKQVEPREFFITFEPEAVMGECNLMIEPRNEKFMLTQAEIEGTFGKGTACSDKFAPHKSRAFVYERPYGSFSVCYTPPNDVPGTPSGEIETAKGKVNGCDVVGTVSFWWQHPKQAATAPQYSETVSWQDMLLRARKFLRARDFKRVEALLHAAFEKQESLEPTNHKARHDRIKELKAAFTEFFEKSEKPEIVAYLQRSSCFQFEEDLRKQMCGPMYSFPTIEEDRTKPWHVTISKGQASIGRLGIGEESLPATSPQFERLYSMFGYCDKEVPDLPADVVDAFYYK